MSDPVENVRDEALLGRFAERADREALGALVERYRDAVYDLAFRILRSESDAADATQAAFLSVLRSAKRFRGTASVRTWLYRIALNEALKLRTIRERRRRMERPISDSRPATADSERERWLAALDLEVDALPEAYRLPVLLHYYRGLSYDEAANVLECAPGTVGSRLATARERLRERLAPLGLAAAVPDLDRALRAIPASAAPPALKGSLVSLITTAVAPPAPVSFPSWATLGAVGVASAVALVALWPRGEPDLAGTVEGDAIAAPAPETSRHGDLSPETLSKLRSLGYVDQRRSGQASDESPAEAATHDLRITGVVYDRASGLPVPQVTVQLFPIWPAGPSVASIRRAVTDDAGAYSLAAIGEGPALYLVEVDPGNAYQTVAQGVLLEAQGESVERVDFAVSPGSLEEYRRLRSGLSRKLLVSVRDAARRDRTASISGTVSREDGRPAEQSVWIQLVDAGGAYWNAYRFEVYDPETGEFLVAPVPAGRFRLEATTYRDGHAILEGLEVHEGQAISGLRVVARTGEATIEGRVVDSQGRPLAGVLLASVPDALADAEGGRLPTTSSARSDLDGQFTLAHVGPPGEAVRLVLEAAGFRSSTVKGIAAGATGLILTLERIPGVRGRIVLLPDRSAVTGPVDVQILPLSPAGPARRLTLPFSPETKHLDDGRFALALDAAGSFEIRIKVAGRAEVVLPPVIVGEEEVDLREIAVE